MGDEISLIYQATERVVKPGNLPISAGVIVYNVETCLNVANALILGKPLTEKWLTVGASVVMLALLWVLLRRRDRLRREREEDEKRG